MSTLIANAIGEVERLTTADSVRSLGASIIARPALTEQEIQDVQNAADVPDRTLVYREGMSDDDRTWFDLQRE